MEVVGFKHGCSEEKEPVIPLGSLPGERTRVPGLTASMFMAQKSSQENKVKALGSPTGDLCAATGYSPPISESSLLH